MKQQFKKGDLVTRIASWDRTGTVYVTHYIVSSWGKQQATLIKVNDLTNAKFRVYTDRAELVQGIHSSKIIATVDYSDALALQLAAEWIADEHERAAARLLWATGRGQHLDFERTLFAEHNATAWTPAVKVMT
jgi:hypothetical protein